MYLRGFSRFAQATMAVVSGHALNLPESIPGRDRSSKRQSRRASACNLHAQFFVHIIISYHLLTSYHCIIGKYSVPDSKGYNRMARVYQNHVLETTCVCTPNTRVGGKPWDS